MVNYAKSASAAEKVVSEIKELGSTAIAIQADVSKPAEITTLFEKAMAHFGHLDIVVSNSGVETFGHISNVTVEEFDRVFAVNTRGQFLVAQAAYKHISNGGRLILQSSISAQARIPNHSVYAGSKAAVEAFARHLSVGAFLRLSGSFHITQIALEKCRALFGTDVRKYRFRFQEGDCECYCSRRHQKRHVYRSS